MADPAAPLHGWRVVVTRAAESSSSLNEQLHQAGAEPIPYPAIAYAPPDDIEAFDTAIMQLASGSYEWLIVTSIAGVRAIQARLDNLYATSNIPPALVGDLRVAAVGSATASACRDLLDMTPDVVPDTYTAEHLAAALGDLRGQAVLLAQADLARPLLAEMLIDAGANLHAVVAYRTVLGSGGADVPAMLAAGTIDAITFTSGSTVRNFVQRIGADYLAAAQQTVIACIGTVTATAAEKAGLPPTVVAKPFTVEGLIAALIAYRKEHH